MSRQPTPLDAEARRKLDEVIARQPVVHDYNPVLWPPVFIAGKLSTERQRCGHQGSAQARWLASTAALVAWGNCARGCAPPEKLACGLLALADWAGLSVEDLLAERAGEVERAALAAVVAGRRAVVGNL
jgi:hypothetical protein